MTADIPSWMKPARKGLGLGEIAPAVPKAPPRKTGAPQAELVPEREAAILAIEEAEILETTPAPASMHSSLSEEELIGPEILAAILPKLRGVRSVTVRVFGSNREAGPALYQLLRRRGLDVKLSAITQIVPPPISKLSVRYQGPDATITLAPDIGP